MIFDNKMRVELIKTNASDEDVARAAWVSNIGEDARTKDATRIKGLINFLYRNKHLSPFEHGSFTFFIDCPIFVAREFMRHRTFSYNEVSGRYTEMKPKFYLPPSIRPTIQSGKIGQYHFERDDALIPVIDNSQKAAYTVAWNEYEEQLSHGVAREVARNPLPLGLYTQFYATCNPRNLMQFIALRAESDALFEIRDVADQMAEYLEDTMPLTYGAFTQERDYDRIFRKLREVCSVEELEAFYETKIQQMSVPS